MHLNKTQWAAAISVLLLVGAVSSVALARLYLTALPLLAGCALVLWAYTAGQAGRPRLRDGLTIGGFTLVLLGSAFVLLNALMAVGLYSPVSTARMPARYISDYGTGARPEAVWNPSPRNALGYSYAPNVADLRSTLVAPETQGTRVIYDVFYNIDERGNRSVPDGNAADRPVALFVGGSFTFGEGLNDAETLPNWFARFSGMRVINAGMHGYGSHQALKLLEDDELYARRVGTPVALVIYRMHPDHILRAAGYKSWDPFGPCYRLNGGTRPAYAGPFSACRNGKRESPPRDWLLSALDELSSGTLPATQHVAQTAARRIREPTTASRRDYVRHLAIVEEMGRQAARHGGRLLVISEDLRRAHRLRDGKPAACKTDPLAQRLQTDLESRGIQVISTSAILDMSACARGIYAIPGDGHPSSEANRVIAAKLAAQLVRS